MTTPSSYVFNADPRSRIQAAEDLLDDGSRRLLLSLGVGEGWSCLEVGAGGGSIARWLAEAVGSGGHVVATDLDAAGIELPAQANVEKRQHDIVHDPLDGAFDLIHTRLVLEHLPEREAVLDKLVAALREGGWLLVEDVDYVSGIPISELGRAEHEHTQAVRLHEFSRLGVDPYFGRHLPDRLRDHGLSNVGNEGRVWVMEGGSAGARWFKLSLAHLRGQLVGPGKLTDAEIDRMLGIFDEPGFAAFSPIIVGAWGQKGRAQ
jgi:SAM-dependent methyltransferase